MKTATKARRKAVSFKVTRAEYELVFAIVERADTLGMIVFDRTALAMDIIATHANGTPLRLADLLAADRANFGHDVCGIARYMDRKTGQLTDHFLPRFTAPRGR